jgi:hypothetical protein
MLFQLLYASGMLFMGATEEQMNLVAGSGLDHVSYVLILYSLSFVIFLFVNMLVHLYDRSTTDPTKASPAANGRPRMNGRHPEDTQLREAQEFELEGLVSDVEDEEAASRRKLLKEETTDDDMGLLSPSTVGRNSDRVAR